MSQNPFRIFRHYSGSVSTDDNRRTEKLLIEAILVIDAAAVERRITAKLKTEQNQGSSISPPSATEQNDEN